jgi:hypothetical protein
MQLQVERREESWMSSGPTTGYLPSIDEVLGDPAASDWLKTALRSALCRDPVDAANDSEMLARLLEDRCDKILSKP